MMVVEGTVPDGRLKKTWQNCVSEDLSVFALYLPVSLSNYEEHMSVKVPGYRSYMMSSYTSI